LQTLLDDYPHPTDTHLHSASTGQLYAQIVNGAPFDMLFAADRKHPLRLETHGYSHAKHRYTYAIGQLAIWSATHTIHHADAFKRYCGPISIANPNSAPYGQAAQHLLEQLGWSQRCDAPLIRSTNVAQAYQQVHIGAVAVGVVSLSQLVHHRVQTPYWQPPTSAYPRLEQQAVLLKRSAKRPEVLAVWDYLQSPVTTRRIQSMGYEVTHAADR